MTDQRRKAPGEWHDPPREFSQAPFWFWNDDLTKAELLRQIEDFQSHGIHAFVIHPRAGLPRSVDWLGERMIGFMRFAVREAARRGMWVILYDEGMYPSGSSSGQVVAENRAYRTRGLVAIDLHEAKPATSVEGVLISRDGEPVLAADQTLVAITERKTNGRRIAVVDRAAQDGHSVIRGLHFTEQNPSRRIDHREVTENLPPAADILNPEAVSCFIRLVYQKLYDELTEHFGKTIQAMFTDEPSLLAKRPERGMVPGTTGILEHVNRFLGYDFTEHLPALWFEDEPDAGHFRSEYNRAVQARLEETFYRPISEWCGSHGVALTGHPSAPDDIGLLRYFHIPGQDIVWRNIEPGKASALEGEQSTQAKCASSAMIHLERRRNLNEYCGAYGHEFTFDEIQWLANWLLVRGCNMLLPHAFYYSVRGPRVDERPPDVGPNSPWWREFTTFARATSRLCWLNTDSTHVCKLAVLGRNEHLPWRSAKVCFQNQRDFNYVEARHLWEEARVDSDGIRLAGMRYSALILEEDPPGQARAAIDVLEKADRVIRWNEDMGDDVLVSAIDKLVPVDARISPEAPDLRVRHVRKCGADYYLLFNEGENDIDFAMVLGTEGDRTILDPLDASQCPLGGDEHLLLPAHALCVLLVETK